ncbi:type II toxin-antitoxin system RelE/ParE family toxin [Kiloniella laminariae]|uniref:type II toxin-antitoxin system RelE/ParE family toxin n=1 Tax=Kiloniella laminariae TaxID=454162 RepID=UPI0003A04E94|nr:type II toxin-antitoxin system RelE/ParE family toxin [Kiloniella laminariae]
MIEIKQTPQFEKWLDSLRDKRTQLKIASRILRLKSGLDGDIKPVGAGVSELRINYGPGFRLYLIKRGNEYIILLCGGDKSTQSRDIRLAKELAEKWK